MSDPVRLDSESLERLRSFLLMLARAQLGPKYRAKIEPDEIVNQTLFDAHRQRNLFRGTSEPELIAWLRKVLEHNTKDALKYLHREKRDIDRENGRGGAEWNHDYGHFLDATCGWTSPSMKLMRHEREVQLADALARLPESQRDAIELHHLHGCTLAETAQRLDRTVASVVGLLRRGLKHLRELLHEPTTGYR